MSQVCRVGINYEGGKIIDHVSSFSGCMYYANCQICMDAPYKTNPRVADEKLRSKGRSECQFEGYDEVKLVQLMMRVFEEVKSLSRENSVKVVIQIARGRAAECTAVEVILPILAKLGITNFETVFGYRSGSYFSPSDESESFIFVNYGMFAELSSDDLVVGDLCNPILSHCITCYDDLAGFNVKDTEDKCWRRRESDDKNILNRFPDSEIKHMTIFGIEDDMPFITPDLYRAEHIEKLTLLGNCHNS